MKRQDGKVSPAQQAWIDGLGNAGAEVYVWRPYDWLAGTIQRLLER